MPEFDIPSPEDQVIYDREARSAARLLAAPHAPTLQPAPYTEDYAQFPHRHPRAIYVPGQALSPPELEVVAEAINPNYPAMVEAFESDPSTAEHLGALLEAMQAGHNGIITTPHGEITDIALAGQAVANWLYKRGSGFIPQRLLLASKMIPEVDYVIENPKTGEDNAVDGVAVIKSAYDHAILTWPRTESARAITRSLPESMVKYQNQQAKLKRAELSALGALLSAISFTGTTRIVQDTEGNYVLPRVNDATADMVLQDEAEERLNYTLPLAVIFEPDASYMRVAQAPAVLTERGQVHAMMGRMAEVMSELVPGKTFTYSEE